MKHFILILLLIPLKVFSFENCEEKMGLFLFMKVRASINLSEISNISPTDCKLPPKLMKSVDQKLIDCKESKPDQELGIIGQEKLPLKNFMTSLIRPIVEQDNCPALAEKQMMTFKQVANVLKGNLKNTKLICDVSIKALKKLSSYSQTISCIKK